MATLREQMADHVGTVFLQEGHFAETILWKPDGAPSITVVGVISRRETSSPVYDMGTKVTTSFDFTCSSAVVAAVTVEVDLCEYDGQEFIVVRDQPGQHGQRIISFRVLDRRQVSPGDYTMGA